MGAGREWQDSDFTIKLKYLPCFMVFTIKSGVFLLPDDSDYSIFNRQDLCGYARIPSVCFSTLKETQIRLQIPRGLWPGDSLKPHSHPQVAYNYKRFPTLQCRGLDMCFV